MTTETRHELTKAEALDRLEPFQTHVDPCEQGHVEHTADDHLGRRIIHSVSPRGFGADWDADGVVAFIEASVRIVDVGGTHPLAVFSDGRWIKFEGTAMTAPTRLKPTQTERLIAYVRANPGVTGLELVKALSLPKYTSRISDARALGVQIVCMTRKDGRKGYVVVL